MKLKSTGVSMKNIEPPITQIWRTGDQRLNALFLLFFLTVPLGIQALTNLCFLLILLQALWSLKWRDWRGAFRRQTVGLSMLFWLILLVSLFWSEDHSRGNRLLETKQAFLVGPLLLMAARDRLGADFRKKGLTAFVWGNVIAAVVALGVGLGRAYHAGDHGSLMPYITGGRLSEPIMHRGYFATFLGLAFLIVLWRWWQGRVKRPLLAALQLTLFGAMLLLLQGRMNIIALVLTVAGLVATLAIKKGQLKTILKLGLVLILLLTALYGIEKAGYGRLSKTLDFNFTALSQERVEEAPARVAIWWGAAEAFGQAPLVGYGIGDAQHVLDDTYQALGFKSALSHRHNAHNQFLETGLQAGLLGIVLLLALFFRYGQLAWRSVDWLTLACLSFFLLCLLTEAMLERAWGVVLFNSLFPLLTLGTDSRQPD